MKARFMIEAPDDIVCTMKLTMTVKEWTILRDDLGKTWPSSRLFAYITEILTQARKVYYAEQEAQP